jgi:glycosyltransferase involved in cell wall biosynthesis
VHSDEFVVGAVGRLSDQKDFGHLLRAIRLLVDTDPEAHRRLRGLIVGPDGGARAALEAEAQSLGIADRAVFLGARSDVPELLRAFDAFVMCSRYEGLPFALLEAMAMGVPVVATAVGSIPEVIDGSAFLVVEPFDTASALGELMHNPGLGEQLGRNGRARARQHDVTEMMRRYEDVIEEALAEATGRR